MRLVIVTGMSGAGKRTAMKMLEDIGFYCVDNLPPKLIGDLVRLYDDSGEGIDKVALGLDIRGDSSFSSVTSEIDALINKGIEMEIIFMDAQDETLINRYKESRRIHPLCLTQGSRVEDGIRKEREVLSSIRQRADYIFDTTKLLTRNLKKELNRIFLDKKEYQGLEVSILSFGFKYGIPADADLVFDVRFLPNPFYIEELKPLSGKDDAIKNYVFGFEEATEFLDKLQDMLDFLLPRYVNEGKNELLIAIGCTGGRHRSVALADAIYDRMREKEEEGYRFAKFHRDIYR